MDRDLLPWILGGALITTGAIAGAYRYSAHDLGKVVVARGAPAGIPGSGSSAASAPVAASPASPPSPPPAAPAPAAGAMSDLAARSPLAPGSHAAAESPPLPPGQVWQCMVNGQKVFSDTRCGSGAAVKQLGELNVMDVPPPPQYPSAYGSGAYGPSAYGSGANGPHYVPYPSAAPYPGDEPDAGDVGDVGGEAYPVEIIVARERARRWHRLREAPPMHAPAPHRGGAAPHSTH